MVNCYDCSPFTDIYVISHLHSISNFIGSVNSSCRLRNFMVSFSFYSRAIFRTCIVYMTLFGVVKWVLVQFFAVVVWNQNTCYMILLANPFMLGCDTCVWPGIKTWHRVWRTKFQNVEMILRRPCGRGFKWSVSVIKSTTCCQTPVAFNPTIFRQFSDHMILL